MARKHDVQAVDSLIESTAKELGERFAAMGLLEAEKAVRAHAAEYPLPGKTLLRERINKFRAARWPSTAPKPFPYRF